MSCSAYLWGGLVKNKGRVGLFQISQKERLFHLLYQPSDNLAMWSLFLHPSKKGLSFSFSLGKKRIYLETQLIGEFTDLFFKIGRVLPVTTGRVGKGWWTGYSLFLHIQSRQRMVNTLLMIKINPTCKRLLIFICQENNKNLACISNKQVINC